MLVLIEDVADRELGHEELDRELRSLRPRAVGVGRPELRPGSGERRTTMTAYPIRTVESPSPSPGERLECVTECGTRRGRPRADVRLKTDDGGVSSDRLVGGPRPPQPVPHGRGWPFNQLGDLAVPEPMGAAQEGLAKSLVGVEI